MNTVVSREDQLIFAPTVTGLCSHPEIRKGLTPELNKQLVALGIDLEHPQPAYPIERFEAALELLAHSIFKETEVSVAMRRLGQLQVLGFATTPIGWALFKVMRLLPLRHLLQRITSHWRSANNFTQARVTELGAGRYQVWVNDVGRYPEVFTGILEAALSETGHRLHVQLLGREGVAGNYLLAEHRDAR